MSLRLALRVSRPVAWMGGVNYLLNICRVTRAHSLEVEPRLYVPDDVDDHLKRQFISANGGPPKVIAERSRKQDNLAMLGISDRADMALFAGHGIDLVFESAGFYGPRPAIPTLSWLPDFQHRRLPHLFSRGQWLARDARFRRILGTRRHILLSSQSALADMRRFYPAPRGEVHVVPFAIRLESDFSAEECRKAREKFGLPERFLFLPNQFWVHKNHEVVVEALGILGTHAPVVATTGNPHDPRAPDLFDRLKSRIDALNIADRFRTLGQIPYSDLIRLNACAQGLLNPSLFEGWSTSVEEAKALGTSLILSDIDVHREQAPPGTIFFAPTDPADCARAIRLAMETDVVRDDALVRSSRLAMERSFAQALAGACLAAVG